MAVTRASLRRFIGTPTGDAEQDLLLDELLAAASASVTRVRTGCAGRGGRCGHPQPGGAFVVQ